MFKKKIAFLIVCFAFIIFSYNFLDRQIVWYLYSLHARQLFLMSCFADGIPALVGAGVFLFYLCCFIFYKGLYPGWMERVIVICNAVVVSIFLKNIFKIIFSRYWPATFECHNRSLLSDGAYGFNWFQGGSHYGSFPSGHASLICAFGVSLWHLFPKLRWLAVLLMLLVLSSQVGMYYHFLSDVVAGALLGYAVASQSVLYLKRSG